jgi:hypothetical protein
VDTVDPNQKYWDLGLACFNKGDVVSVAIQTVWGKMQPPASLATLATIIGALYADNYWVKTKMSSDMLAGDIMAATGLHQSDCQRAARVAFNNWYGLLVRSNTGDYGSIPKPDPVTASPDVVINGAASLTLEHLIRTWDRTIYTPQSGLKNNCYGRAQSTLTVPITTPVLRMYYSDAGFNPPPDSWIQLFTFDGAATPAMQGMAPGPVNLGENRKH